MPGKNPIVANGSINNGIVGFSGLETTEKGNMITFSDTTTSDAIFYQPKAFIGYPHVQGLYPKKYQNEWNEVTLLYFMTAFKKCACGRFDYATKFTRVIASNMQVKMPINEHGEIDFLFIENYMQAIKDYRIKGLNDYLNAAGFEDCTLTTEEEQALAANVLYKPFDIVKEFNVANSHNILKSDVVFGSGSTPYVTACESNNSVVSHISYKDDAKEEGNSIMIGGKTLVITYQPKDFFSNDSHNLVLKINDVNGRTETAQLFMVAALYKSLSPKYSWGDSISKAKIQKDTVSFPVTPNGCIDFNYMETYIRAIMKQTIGKLKAAMTIDAQQVTIEEGKPKILDYVAEQDRFTTHLPVYPLRAACGYFDDCGQLQEEVAEGWIDASSLGHTLNDKMFVVHAEGDSMEPKIHDGELCVFDAAGAGSREGKIVLCKARDKSDRNASSFTIKMYHSEKIANEDGWMHSKITLSPLNSNYNPIIISAEDAEEDEFKIYGEFICVI